MIYASQTRLQDAIRAYGARHGREAALTIRELRASDSSLNPNVYRDSGIANSLLRAGHPAAAERTMAAVTRDQPDSVIAWFALTRIQVARGRLAAARASYARVRRLDPHLPAALPSGA
jgi:predicted Zn-dependent protease